MAFRSVFKCAWPLSLYKMYLLYSGVMPYELSVVSYVALNIASMLYIISASVRVHQTFLLDNFHIPTIYYILLL